MAEITFLTDLYTDIRAIVFATWPEVVARVGNNGNGVSGAIWDAEHLDQVPYSTAVPPFAVLHMGDVAHESGWGAGNNFFRVKMDIYYFCAVRGPLSGIQQKLADLMQPLWQSDFLLTDSQVTGIENLAWHDDLVPNRFLAASNKKHRAGCLTASLLVPMRLSYPAPPTE